VCEGRFGSNRILEGVFDGIDVEGFEQKDGMQIDRGALVLLLWWKCVELCIAEPGVYRLARRACSNKRLDYSYRTSRYPFISGVKFLP
jgi:hypothetical protein